MIVYSLTIFKVRFKQIVTLTTFTDSVEELLNQLLVAKLFLLFHSKNVKNVLRLVTIFFKVNQLSRNVGRLIMFRYIP